ncbi:MAG: DUF4111 domain-containing protein, partial [Caldilineae bacterium]
MNCPQEVAEILSNLLAEIRQAIPDNLVGVYLRGSLAYGDFRPATSDLDVLVVTKRLVSDTEFQCLADLHKRIGQSNNPYAQRIEIAYIDREGVREYRAGQQYPTLEQGADECLKWSEHRENWVLERWSVREYGKALYGPAPKELIAPVSSDTIRQAVHNRLQDWVEWARDVADPDWRLPKGHKAYVVETMCRILYVLENGELVTKSQAVEWAENALPWRWKELVGRS